LDYSAAVAAAVLCGRSTFKNAAWVASSPTLYMTIIPATTNALDALEDMTKQQEGFIPPMRQAKGGATFNCDKCYASFAEHRLRGHQVGGGAEKGINFSYDKDDSEEKRKEKESRQLLNQALKSASNLVVLFAVCELARFHLLQNTMRIVLVIVSMICLQVPLLQAVQDAGKDPRGSTDNSHASHVVSEEKYVVSNPSRRA